MNIYPNFEEYYTQGFTQFRLPRVHSDRFRGIINSIDWVRDPSRGCLSVPSDQVELIIKAGETLKAKESGEQHGDDDSLLKNYSKKCEELMSELLDDEAIMGTLKSVYDLEIENFYLYNGAEETGWHFDVHENSDMILLVYMTDESYWDQDWGGYFEVAERSLEINDIRSGFSQMKTTARILPENRTALLVSNRNPRIVHRSVQLAEERNRITLYAGIRFVNKKGDH